MRTLEDAITDYAGAIFSQTAHLSDREFATVVDRVRSLRASLQEAKDLVRSERKLDPAMLELARRELNEDALFALGEINLLDDDEELASYPGRS